MTLRDDILGSPDFCYLPKSEADKETTRSVYEIALAYKGLRLDHKEPAPDMFARIDAFMIEYMGALASLNDEFRDTHGMDDGGAVGEPDMIEITSNLNDQDHLYFLCLNYSKFQAEKILFQIDQVKNGWR